jgi:hypothetical protein
LVELTNAAIRDLSSAVSGTEFWSYPGSYSLFGIIFHGHSRSDAVFDATVALGI